MSDLVIPPGATAAAARARGDGATHIHDLLVAAAPIIVVAELRRLAAIEKDECETWRQYLVTCVPGSEGWKRNAEIYDRHFAAMTTLERRADELDEVAALRAADRAENLRRLAEIDENVGGTR